MKDKDIRREISETPRRVIEICCGKNSALGQKTRYSENCEVVRITIEDDFTTEKGFRKAADKIDSKTVIFISLPCTWGCPFNEIN